MFAWILLAAVAVAELSPAAIGPVDFVKDIRPIFQQACIKCHGPEKQKGGFRLDVKAAALKGGDDHAPAIVPGDSARSPLIRFVAGDDPEITMPPQGDRLTPEQVGRLRAWIDRGADWPDTASAALDDPITSHWAFQPVRRPPVPNTIGTHSTLRNPIDAFIARALAERGLTMSPEADRRTLMRRLSLDLIGLPPTPEELAAFVADTRPSAYDELVDRLLDSPHYGERWARHWLDVIAFGETHGFEVNTPRDNAWPYRDYVIRALNADTPYPEFITAQLAGDATGEDAATGFLVARAALLPGQIGRDLESIRLARQDVLNDMVLGTGGTFLGLTIHCARCHDHKFDPISQRDYYAMTAFFAGVQHGERPIRTAAEEARQREASRLQPRLGEIESQLCRFVPLANPSLNETRPTSARRNEERFPAMVAKFVRFTILDANLHPTLGLIEPCIDELEVFSTDGRNVALATAGAKVSASGSIAGSAIHRLEHINDGKYGNGRSWMSAERGRGWVLLELNEPTRVDRIVWGRDREGTFSDRLATAYTLEVGPSLEAMSAVAARPPLRPAVSPQRTVDRFPPVATRRLRFTILEATSLEPCLDELEVFTAGADPRNAALASTGAKVTASGTIPGSAIHRLEHLNDGRYGNARSWISSTTGRGWVEVEFPSMVTIDRVVWSRDRESTYTDRLATSYRIEVADELGRWTVAASSRDRQPYVLGVESRATYISSGREPGEAETLRRLLEEKCALEARVKELTRAPMVYAGVFAAPEETFRLHRGDPMQRREPVAPGALTRFGPRLALPAGAPEQARRLALAEWIAAGENPLTARVLVNRLWHYHFGEGLVNTPSDLGRNGARPVNEPLLNWLAGEFVARGWSIKTLQKLIVTSATFRQSSRPSAAAKAVDARTRLLWRFPPRRLEAEAIHDSMLAVAGTLESRMGGPGFSVFAPNDNYVRVYNPRTEYGPAEWRRMIYQTKVRMAQDSTFGAFDCPDAGQNQPNRPRSTTPLQALNLFNSRFVAQQAARFAARLRQEEGADPAAQVRRGFQLALGREPDSDESRRCIALVGTDDLSTLCLILFNTNEFVFLP